LFFKKVSIGPGVSKEEASKKISEYSGKGALVALAIDAHGSGGDLFFEKGKGEFLTTSDLKSTLSYRLPRLLVSACHSLSEDWLGSVSGRGEAYGVPGLCQPLIKAWQYQKIQKGSKPASE